MFTIGSIFFLATACQDKDQQNWDHNFCTYQTRVMHFLSLLRNKQDKKQTIILLWNMASFIFLLKTTQQDEHNKFWFTQIGYS